MCSPERIRTAATALRGRRPRPLDDGALETSLWCNERTAGVPGLEPRLTEPESVGLPITPYPIRPVRRGRPAERKVYRTGRLPPNSSPEPVAVMSAPPGAAGSGAASRAQLGQL